MKKKNLIAALACLTLLVGCDEIQAKPNYVDDKLVVFNDNNSDVYKNEFTGLYDALVDAGTSNSTIVDELLLRIAKKESGVFANDPLAQKGYKSITEAGFLTAQDGVTAEERFERLVDDYMVDLVLGGSYSEDYLFQEDKFAREQREALYVVTDKNVKDDEYDFKEDVDLIPGITFDQIFTSRESYADYRERKVKPIIYKRLLTAKYLYNNKYKTLGRSAARNVRVVKIDNSSTEDNGSALRTLNNYIAGFLYASTSGKNDAANYFPGVKDATTGFYDFSVESISNIWKGIWRNDDAQAQREQAFVQGTNLSSETLYTLHDTIEKDLEKIASYDSTTGKYTLLSDLDFDNSTIANTVSDFTGGYAYSINWGLTLKERQLNANDLTEDDFFVEKTGLTNLPSAIRSRLFSMTVSKNVATVGGTTFLLPETQENQDQVFKAGDNSALKFDTREKAIAAASNLIHYDSASSTYYIVLVDQFAFATTDLEGGDSKAENVNVERKEKATEIAILLGENSTYQKDTLLHYFEEYELAYHDDAFFEYVESTYEELFEDDED